MASMFLSYAREDRRFAETLARVLERAGHSVWWDRRLDGGEEFSAEIEAALEKSDAVLVAWSQFSVKSRWVRDEAAVGGDRGILVPVSIDGSLPPMGFRQFHTLDLSGWKGARREQRTDELLRSVERRLSDKPKPLPVDAIASPASRTNRKPVWIATAAVIVLLVSALAIFLVERVWNAPKETAASLAVLPFTSDSSDGDARKLATETRDAVMHTLSQGAFSVSELDAPPTSGPAPAEFLLTGHVSTTADKVSATVRIEGTARHFILMSHEWEEDRTKGADLPERIGAQVASQVSWTAPLIALERKHPSDPAVVSAILGGSEAGLESGGALADYETSRRLAAKAPDSPLAQNSFAFNTAFALDQIPSDERAEAVAAARQAVDRTIELAPEYGSAYTPWCLLHSEQRRVECEAHLRTGMKVNSDDPFVNWFLAGLLLEVGRDAEGADLARVSYAHDEFMPHKIGLMLRALEITGQSTEASQLYDRGSRWWPKNPALSWRRLSGMIARGDFEAALKFEREFEPTHPDDPLPGVVAALKTGSIPGLRNACARARDEDGVLCMLALARAGSLDDAYRLADEVYPSRRGRTLADEERIWLDNPGPMSTFFITGPGAAPLRRDPRFLALAQRTGLLSYWRSGRPPDFCKPPHSEPVCGAMLKRS